MEVKCTHCATPISRPASHLRGAKAFCNFECRKSHSRPQITCAGCGALFARDPKTPAKVHCSWDCFKASRWADVLCATCGVSFRKRESEIKRSSGTHLCTRACRNVFTSLLLGGNGEWTEGGKHGPSRTRGSDWKEAKAFALARDGSTCQQCSATSSLEVHHWEPYSISFDNSPENLVTLCRTCHQDKHAEYRREGFYEDVHRAY